MAHSEVNDAKFVLVSARKSRVGDHWDKDDYDVRLGDASGLVVDRTCCTHKHRKIGFGFGR